MYSNKETILAAIAIVAGILAVGTIVSQPSAAQQSSSSSLSSLSGGAFASVRTEITDTQIIITIDKNPNAPTEESPPPIIVVPPNATNPDNVTVIPIPPSDNTTTSTGNETGEATPGAGNVTIIEPGGNISIIEDGNATIIDNGTAVIVSPPDRNVTETPGDVVVIDPVPVAPPVVEECGCPVGVEGGAPDIQLPPQDNASLPFFSNNTNITVQQPIVPEELPSEEMNNNNGDGDNGGDNNNGGN